MPIYRRLIPPLLLVSFGLRVWLASGGGQGFWDDELMRYGEARVAAENVWQADWPGLARELFGHVDHQLFRWVALPPALLGWGFAKAAFGTACYFSLISTLIIWLVWWVARRAGAGEREAFFAALLAACASTLFFYARHFLPYDASMSLLLLALGLGLGRSDSWGRFLVVGMVVGLGFLTYNGYWLPGAALLVLLTSGGRDWPARGRRALAAGSGLILTILGFILAGQLLGLDMVALYLINSGTVNQGDFYLGYRVIGEYLWHAEHGLLGLWVGGLVAGLWLCRKADSPARVRGWLGAIVFILIGLVVLSDLWTKLVVYGRLVRPIVPCCCLLSAYALERLFQSHRTSVWLPWAVGAGLILLAAPNFIQPLRQTFPEEFRRQAGQLAASSQQSAHGLYRIRIPGSRPEPPLSAGLGSYQTLLERRHPLQFRPYQYEGFTLAQRNEFSEPDRMTMQLAQQIKGGDGVPVQLEHDEMNWASYPGPVRMVLSFPTDRWAESQPLVTSGMPGKGTFLYVVYVDAGHVKIGFDDWGMGGPVSDLIPVDYGKLHELIVSYGAMLPPLGIGLMADKALWPVKDQAVVVLDGKIVLSKRMPSWPSPSNMIFLGSNIIGGGTASQAFTGQIKQLEHANFSAVCAAVPALFLQTIDHQIAWGGAPGYFEMELTFTREQIGVSQPLACSGKSAQGDLLSCRVDAAGRLQFSLDHWGTILACTQPVAVNFGEPVKLGVFLGSFLPSAGAALYQEQPELLGLRNRLLVTVNGRPVWSRAVKFYDAHGHWVAGANDLGFTGADPFITENVTGLRPMEFAPVLAATHRSNIQRDGVLWEGFPGPVELLLMLPAKDRASTEPLITSGETGAGDFVYIRYEDERHIRIGYDHWGDGGPLSDPVEIDPAQPLVIVVNAGFLYPPAEDELFRQNPGLKKLRDQLWVSVNGRAVLAGPARFHPAQPDRIVFGLNNIGGSTSSLHFSGELQEIRHASPTELSNLVFAREP